jgi:hypothetical protein
MNGLYINGDNASLPNVLGTQSPDAGTPYADSTLLNGRFAAEAALQVSSLSATLLSMFENEDELGETVTESSICSINQNCGDGHGTEQLLGLLTRP